MRASPGTIASALAAASFISSGARAAAPAESVIAGRVVFQEQCQSCHSAGPGAVNRLGPHLNGLIGRRAGSVEGYGYSSASRRSGITWDAVSIASYLGNLRLVMPGTKMAYAGLKDENQLSDLIAFLESLDATGEPKPAVK